MSGIQIGRFGSTGNVDAVLTWDMSGDTVSVTGWIQGGTVSDAQDLRAQLEGYVDSSDEPQVPVVWSEDPSVNGFYTVSSASVTVDAQGFAAGWFPWSATLVRTAAWSSPLVESRILGALRSGLGPAAAGWQAVQGAATSYTASGAALTAGSRQTASGIVRLFTGGSNALLNARASWHVPPESWYDGAATLEVGPVATLAQAVFTATGATQTYTVPAGITTVTLDAYGAAGGSRPRYAANFGGRTTTDVTVAPGDVLTVTVGMQPTGAAGGYGGGGAGGTGTHPGYGGGGASRVVNGTGSVLLVVAAGGGGGGSQTTSGTGSGGGANGDYGAAGGGSDTPAYGGTQTAGGAGGTTPGGPNGTAGASAAGGVGASAAYASGGGGGGYFGGGGAANGQDGGGGSAYASGFVSATAKNVSAGHGSVIITPQPTVPMIAYQTVVGRQILPYPFGWRLSNGIMRIMPAYVGSSLQLACQWWTGAAWSTPKLFQIVSGGGGGSVAALQLVTVTALRNAPEECRVRLSLQYTGNVQTVTVDLAMRRGAPFVGGRITATTTNVWGIGRSVVETSTAVTGGVYASSPDADNITFVLYSGAVTTDNTFGIVTLASTGTTMDFCLGASIGPSPAATDTPAALLNQYFAAATEQVNVVGR